MNYEDLERIRDEKEKAGRKAIYYQSKYRKLDAFRGRMWSKLFLRFEGTVAQRNALVEVSNQWKVYLLGLLNTREAAASWEHIRADLQDQWLATYQELKQQEDDRRSTFAGGA